MGIKPFYFATLANESVGQVCYIVSEPKQLTALPEFRPRMEPQQIVDFLAEDLIGHEADRCCFEGVDPLPAGHRIEWSLGSLPDVKKSKLYWQPQLQTQDMDWDEAVLRTGELFRDSVKLRLRSDVPIGASLSGGIDSSSIVGVAALECGNDVKTFSLFNREAAYDESTYIDAVNRHCNTTGISLYLDEETSAEELENLIYHQDEPITRLSHYAEYCVMRAAKEGGVTVLLSGQGGDETLCGYRKFAFFQLQQLMQAGRFVAAMRHGFNVMTKGDQQILDFRAGLRYAPKWMRRSYDPFDDLLRNEFNARRRQAWKTRMRGVRDIQRHQWADLTEWSLPVLLRYQDRNSMAHSIEARVPMVDHRFVEFALTLPEDFLFHQGKTKRLLVEALGGTLPEEVRNRRTKLGFATPQPTWMKGQLGQALQSRVRNSSRLDQIIDTKKAAIAFDQFRKGDKRYSHLALFRIASLAIWLDRFEVEL